MYDMTPPNPHHPLKPFALGGGEDLIDLLMDFDHGFPGFRSDRLPESPQLLLTFVDDLIDLLLLFLG